MRIADYPPQEPLGGLAEAYHRQVMARAGGGGIEAAYGPDPYQGVLVYPAARPTGDVLVFLHGGGWTNGYKEWMAFMAPAATALGLTFISAGYRLAPAHVFPTGFHDVLAALAWVHGNIASHGGDPDRLFVGGHSAGGHYAALAALTTGWPATHGLPADVIKGALPISGTFYFTEGSGLSMRPRFLGDPVLGHDVAASPLTHVRADAPPFLLAHGERDFPHLSRQTIEFEAALKAAGGEVERLVLPGCDHGTASLAAGDADGPWLRPAAAWMRRH